MKTYSYQNTPMKIMTKRLRSINSNIGGPSVLVLARWGHWQPLTQNKLPRNHRNKQLPVLDSIALCPEAKGEDISESPIYVSINREREKTQEKPAQKLHANLPRCTSIYLNFPLTCCLNPEAHLRKCWDPVENIQESFGRLRHLTWTSLDDGFQSQHHCWVQ